MLVMLLCETIAIMFIESENMDWIQGHVGQLKKHEHTAGQLWTSTTPISHAKGIPFGLNCDNIYYE